eukprot:5895677-Pyramimonas_sp.AAC.1
MAAGGPSAVGTHRGLKWNLAIPGGLRYVKLSQLSKLAGGAQRSGYTPRTQIRPRHPCGAAICETVATLEDCWGAQHS